MTLEREDTRPRLTPEQRAADERFFKAVTGRKAQYRHSIARKFSAKAVCRGFYSAHQRRRSLKDKPHPTLFGWLDHRRQ